MRYRIEGDADQTLVVALDAGEIFYAEPESVLGRGKGLEAKRQIRGRLMRGLKRKLFTGESFFLDEYRASSDGAELRLGRPGGGAVVPVYLHEQAILCRRKSFLGFHGEMDLDVAFAAVPNGGLFPGQGFIVQKISGSGVAFLYADSYVVERPDEMQAFIKRGLGRQPLFGAPAKNPMRSRVVEGIGMNMDREMIPLPAFGFRESARKARDFHD